MLKLKKVNLGFTIVELLVVIVVIGILAAITVVSYKGVNNKAIFSACQSDVSGAKKKLEMYNIEKGEYPPSLIKAGVNKSEVCDISYYLNNNVSPVGYVLFGEKGSIRLIATNTSQVSENTSVEAEGGIISDDGEYRIHIFTEDGMFKITSPNEVVAELLVVAGGGGGGSSTNGGPGGGGAGGLIYYDNYLIPANSDISVVIGYGGGPGVPKPNWGDNGGNSQFGPEIAYGGGGGAPGGTVAAVSARIGRDGGSGGGAGYNQLCPSGTTPPKGGNSVSGQGNKGGSTSVCATNSWSGAGGGGASGQGSVNSVGKTLSQGGAGRNLSISGSKVVYAAGGLTGSATSLKDSPVNSGKGGDAAYATSSIDSKAGGSGVVIVRYKK